MKIWAFRSIFDQEAIMMNDQFERYSRNSLTQLVACHCPFIFRIAYLFIVTYLFVIANLFIIARLFVIAKIFVITYFVTSLLRGVYPRSWKGHQMSDHLDGE